MLTVLRTTNVKVKDLINVRKFSSSALGLCLLLANTDVLAQSQTCFDGVKIEPSFIAFTAKKGSQLGDWYKKTFALETVKDFAFPDGSVTGTLMRKGEFTVEVFYRDDAIDKKEIAPKSKAKQWSGIMKFGIYTDANLHELRQCLKDNNVEATRIWEDKNLGIDLLQVIDPNQNVIEIIQRRAK
ncbi:MAG: hypothetical protein ACI808_003347 [Paraglaciecola sp.]|jgi:hypothetical protein